MPLKEFLWKHNASVDKDNRLHLSCLCDGTLYFLTEMVEGLKALGCTDIVTSEEIITEGMPENKPWCNCLFKASGLLPNRKENDNAAD